MMGMRSCSDNKGQEVKQDIETKEEGQGTSQNQQEGP
jgi:hypothetical protein